MAKELLLAKTPEEAAAAITERSAFVAGGTEVNRLGSDIAGKADTLISLKKCSGLSDISNDGKHVTVGAMCTFQQIAESDAVPAYLREAALFMASRTKRNMASIGGNIAAARDDSYLIPTLLAAGAELEILYKDGTRERKCLDEYLGLSECSMQGNLQNEAGGALITSVAVPADIHAVSKRYANTAQSHAVLTMSASMNGESIRIYGAVKNVGLLHFCNLEKTFRDEPDISEEAIIEMVRTCTGLHTSDDMFGSDAYKRYLIAVTAFDFYRQLKGKGAEA